MAFAPVRVQNKSGKRCVLPKMTPLWQFSLDGGKQQE